MKTSYYLILFSVFFLNCNKDNNSTNNPVSDYPTVTTSAVTLITPTTASGGGNVTSEGPTRVTARGVCWSTSPNPVITGSHTVNGSGAGSFVSSLTGLTPATIYYVRAYATNSVGTAYGNQEIFTSGGGSARDIYIAGWEDNNATPRIVLANIWKNGVLTNLNNGSLFKLSNSIFVSGTDVYVAGIERTSDPKDIAIVWKNGVASPLTIGSDVAEANSVFVQGADVYVAGMERNSLSKDIAKVWKNGVATALSNGAINTYANSVYVSGTDVYVAGYENSAISVAKIWKNGVGTSLTNGTFSGGANSVFVSGTDVYVAGSFNNFATVWKNGIPTTLRNGARASDAYSVYVSGTDVYVAGWGIEFNNGTTVAPFIATLWKNGVPTSLTNDPYPLASQAFGVFVSGADIYVVGIQFNSNNRYVAKVGKNGVPTSLTNGINSGIARGIFIK